MRYLRYTAIGLYVPLAFVWVFWVLDRQLLYGNDVATWSVVIAGAILHIALGFAINRGWALFLPLLAVLIAAPLGYPSENRGEPLPLWMASLIFYAPIYMSGVWVGVAARKLYERRRL